MYVPEDYRFWSKVTRDKRSGCLVWRGALSGRGGALYGTFWNGDKNVAAHRWAWEREFGAIPEGLEIDHLCRNPSCVNPYHLEPVTRCVNNQRAVPFRPKGTHCVNGHEYSSDNSLMVAGVRRCRICRNAAQRAWKARRKETASE